MHQHLRLNQVLSFWLLLLFTQILTLETLISLGIALFEKNNKLLISLFNRKTHILVDNMELLHWMFPIWRKQNLTEFLDYFCQNCFIMLFLGIKTYVCVFERDTECDLPSNQCTSSTLMVCICSRVQNISPTPTHPHQPRKGALMWVTASPALSGTDMWS